MSKKVCFLLDGHALVYRAHFAFIARPLINSKGMNTSAITGFVRTLLDILNNEKPTHIAVVFDPSGDVFRHKDYPEYKANREEQPEDIRIAIPYIKKILAGFNIPVLSVDNYEADDVIGTLSKQAEQEGFKVYMVTPDKDYAQLVSENIIMYKPSRQGNGVEKYGVAEILKKWDIERVEQVIDVLGMQGDSVDNIPGIPGIGAKTAVKLLKQFGSLENLLENTDQLKGKQKEKVEQFADQGRLSKQLATIKLDVPVTFDAEEYTISEINKKDLTEIFKELEFRTLARQILGDDEPKAVQQSLFGTQGNTKSSSSKVKKYAIADKNISNVDHQYQLVDTDEAVQRLVKTLAKVKMISFDTETTGIDATQAELVGLAFAVRQNEAYYVPISDDQEMAKKQCEPFKAILEDASITKVGQNIKYDILMMKWYGIELQGYFFDTMIHHYLCEPDLRHKLDYLSESYLNYKMVPIESLIGKKGKNQKSMRDIAVADVSEYAGEDADITLQLVPVMKDMIKEVDGQSVYDKIEEPLIKVLADIEYEGVKVDVEFLNEYSNVLGQHIKDKEQAIYDQAGTQFNIASPKQVGEVLFDIMKIPYRWRKTKTGQYSTDVEKLTELSYEHEIVNEILEFRKYSKLKSTYVDSIPQMVNPRTGRVHSNFNQARAATGRLSSENPNLQNIPIRDDAGREIRKAFVPGSDEYILLAADYSQIELRLIAEISKDELMLEAFHAGNDFHRATAARVYDVPYDDVTADQRRNAKTVNFSITYGAGATNLSRQLNIKRTEAQELINNYFAQYTGLKRYMDETVAFAKEHGYVQTMLGRRRFLRDINSKNGLLRSNAERMAINTPIQGTAADMIKLAMIDIHQEMKAQSMKSKMIMQVHDELVFDVHRSELDTIQPLIESKMKNAINDLGVPILVGMGTGDNWLEAH